MRLLVEAALDGSGVCRELVKRRGQDVSKAFQLVRAQSLEEGHDLFVCQDSQGHAGDVRVKDELRGRWSGLMRIYIESEGGPKECGQSVVAF